MARQLFALWIGKSILFLTKLLNRGGGTAAPGLYALHIDKNLLEHFTSQIKKGSVIISGTNGKTTTSRLISHYFSRQGISYIHNRAGSNLERGLISTCIEKSDLAGKINVDYGVWELDEAAFVQTFPKIKPTAIILLNLFRDQLDRYGEVDATKNKWLQSLKNNTIPTIIIYNADDPQLVHLVKQLKTHNTVHEFHAFSIKPHSENNSEKDILAPIELALCPQCKNKLDIQSTIAGIGAFTCNHCGLHNGNPDTQITEWQTNTTSTQGTIASNNKNISFDVSLPGLFNIYNLLAGAAYIEQIDQNINTYIQASRQYKPAFARMEQIMYKNKQYILSLIKNPTGFTESLKTIFNNNTHYKTAIFILNDNYADGRDVSWIWDVSLTKYLPKQLTSVTVGGTRVYDMALRMKYAGIDPSQIKICENLHEIFNKQTEEIIPIFATYTASLELQDYFEKNGVKIKYWKE